MLKRHLLVGVISFMPWPVNSLPFQGRCFGTTLISFLFCYQQQMILYFRPFISEIRFSVAFVNLTREYY